MFILKERDDDPVAAFARYRRYLQDNQQRFPPNAYALAISDWWFDFRHHEAPKDAWLESVQVLENPLPQEKGARRVSIKVRLLAAYHDGYIELDYLDVHSYELSSVRGWHGQVDWRYDEFRVNDTGHLEHEIEWIGGPAQGQGCRWLIVADDVHYRWVPRDNDR